ncbi:MAG: radical SAM protein, partial [Bacteroidetes bacterium]|nr:radical SAM protein [Bacteroidota bacterium]
MRHPNTHRRINIITLGCAKNIVDSEVLAGRLAQTGFSLVHERKINPGDIVIVNTCGFIHDAKEESIDTILNLARLRRGGKIAKLIVMGCLTELYATEIREEIPEIDEVFGANKMVDVMRSLTNRYDAHHLVERVPFTPKHTAYLKTSEGCNRRCSFCTIPLIRGKHVSRTLESLVEEAEMLASGGVRELMLIAQDLTYYGVDLYGKRKIAELVHRLAEIRQLKRIRLHYAYPADFPLELLNVMQRHPKVCKYLDIPVQHISDHILQSMKRGIGKSATI